MNNEVAVHHGSGLAITGEQEWWSDKQLAALKQLGIDGASNGDLAVFMHVAQRTGLDPFARQIYMIKRFTKDGPRQTIQTGIDGFRLVARRAADRARETIAYQDTLWATAEGIWSSVWLDDGPPAAAKVVVLRNGKPYPGVAHFREYAQFDKQGHPTSMWAGKPALMLAKCAEAQALRKAFPQDLAGLHTADEMRDEGHGPPTRRVTAREIRREPEPDVPADVDPMTGEIVDVAGIQERQLAGDPAPEMDWPDVAQPGSKGQK